MAEIVSRWEWRTFARSVPRADADFDAMTPASVQESDELYLLAPGGDNVKVRDELMDIKVLRETDAAGLQRFEPILKASFPLDAEAARVAFHGLRRPLPTIPPDGLTLDALLAAAGPEATGGPRAVPVHKRRARYTVAGCQAERSVIEAGGRRMTSVAVESTDPADVMAAIDVLGLRDYLNLDVPTGLRLMVDRVPERYAVIDAGTNSIKVHVAELDADGQGLWQTLVDRAVVTRLGEDLEATGQIGAEPLERTAKAISEMADEARGLDVRAIALVGTAGFRMARNSAEAVQTIRARSGLSLDIISGDDEGRLAYLAVAAGVGLGNGTIVAFDTGAAARSSPSAEGRPSTSASASTSVRSGSPSDSGLRPRSRPTSSPRPERPSRSSWHPSTDDRARTRSSRWAAL